ncbi:MAG: sulfatase-like hydrolase/transferase [Sphingomicrobium sp.]
MARLHAGRRPNIVLITADDLGYGDLSGYGRPDFQTPQLDRLAAQGTRFTQAYSIAPICTPTRVGIMTGRYPARHPVGLREPLTLSPEDSKLGLAPSPPTLPLLLKNAGYTNGLFGKWHLGVQPRFHPNRHGFDEFFGPLGGAVDYVSHTDPLGEHDLYRNGERVRPHGYLTDLIADEAVRFIRGSREPFFLSHQGTAPHSPWQRRGDPPAERVGPGVFRGLDVGPPDRFPDMMAALDQAVGKILAALEDKGVAERTIVIFTSDNGGKQHSNMAGLARGKGYVWEGGIRVPAFVRWPGVIPSSVTTRQVATTLDWTATMLAAAGVLQQAAPSLDGIDLLPVLAGGTLVDRTIFWRMGRERQAAVRSGGWKFLRHGKEEHLFDLVLDPGERRDLKKGRLDLFRQLKARYEIWERDMIPLEPA